MGQGVMDEMEKMMMERKEKQSKDHPMLDLVSFHLSLARLPLYPLLHKTAIPCPFPTVRCSLHFAFFRFLGTLPRHMPAFIHPSASPSLLSCPYICPDAQPYSRLSPDSSLHNAQSNLVLLSRQNQQQETNNSLLPLIHSLTLHPRNMET